MEEEVENAVKEVTEIGASLKKSIGDLNKDFRKEIEKLEGQLKESGRVSEDVMTQFKGIEQKISELEKKHGEEIAQMAVKLNRPDFGQDKQKAESLSASIETALVEIMEKGFGKGIKESVSIDLKGKQEKLLTKAVGDMTNSNFGGQYASRDIRQGVVYDPENPNRIRGYIRVSPMNAPILQYFVETGSEGGVGFQTEGDLKSQIDFDITPKQETPKEIAVFAVSTKQYLSDVPFLASYLTTRMTEKWFNFEDNQIINGNGVGENFKGIINQGIAYVPTSGVANIYYEYLIDAISQQKNAHFNNLRILANPLDFMKLLIYKATPTGEYTHPSLAFGGDGIWRIFGTPIADNSAVPRLTGIVGDFSKAELAVRDGLSFAVSYDDTDNFRRNKVTYRLEGREVLVIEQPKAFKILNFATISS